MGNSRNIRVCLVLHGIVGGGSEQVVLNYCSRMRDIHFDLLYQYEPNPQILERFHEAGINCIQIPDKVHHPLRHLWTMYRFFKHGHYDVVHCHLNWFLNSYACFVAMLAGVKRRVAHHHQAYSKWGFSCAILRVPCKLFATHWLACGEAAAINGWGKTAVKNGEVMILPNAIDPDRFKYSENFRKEVRAMLEIKDDDFIIGHVGRFYPQKNHEFLIKTFEYVHKQKPSAKLLLLGDGPLQDKIRRLVEKLGLSKSVIFAGLQKDPVPFYCAMDVFCLPSLWEGLPLTLVEAQYNGLPCIVSDSVTKEAVVAETVSMLPTNSVDRWRKEIVSFKLSNVRTQQQIKSNLFDIKNCCQMLGNIYCD